MSAPQDTPTPWESLVTTVVNDLIESLPDIIRDGYTGEGVAVPPFNDVTLPDIVGFDTGQKVKLCTSAREHATDKTRLSALDGRLTGLDTVASYAPLAFPVQDVQLSIPLVFNDIVVRGRWESHTPCALGTNPPVDTVHDGTFAVHFIAVQVTIAVTLDATASTVTAVTITLSDANAAWQHQPVFNADTDVTFDPSVTGGQISLIRTLLKTSQFLTTLRDPTKRFIEGPDLAHALKKVIEDVIANAV
jgi:hypothetical protein